MVTGVLSSGGIRVVPEGPWLVQEEQGWPQTRGFLSCQAALLRAAATTVMPSA